MCWRLADCGLELNERKTRVVYCKDDDRRGTYEHTSFDFLSYRFRPRLSKNKFGKHFVNFSPAVSSEAKTRMRREMRSWGVARRSDKTLSDLALMFNRHVDGFPVLGLLRGLRHAPRAPAGIEPCRAATSSPAREGRFPRSP